MLFKLRNESPSFVPSIFFTPSEYEDILENSVNYIIGADDAYEISQSTGAYFSLEDDSNNPWIACKKTPKKKKKKKKSPKKCKEFLNPSQKNKVKGANCSSPGNLSQGKEFTKSQNYILKPNGSKNIPNNIPINQAIKICNASPNGNSPKNKRQLLKTNHCPTEQAIKQFKPLSIKNSPQNKSKVIQINNSPTKQQFKPLSNNNSSQNKSKVLQINNSPAKQQFKPLSNKNSPQNKSKVLQINNSPAKQQFKPLSNNNSPQNKSKVLQIKNSPAKQQFKETTYLKNGNTFTKAIIKNVIKPNNTPSKTKKQKKDLEIRNKNSISPIYQEFEIPKPERPIMTNPLLKVLKNCRIDKITSLEETSFNVGNILIYRERCFLYGISICGYSLKELLKIDQLVEFELQNEATEDVKECWIGEYMKDNKERYESVERYCHINRVPIKLLFELLNEIDYVSEEYAPSMSTEGPLQTVIL